MLVSELKAIINDLDDAATIEGIFVREDIVQPEDDLLTRYCCSVVQAKGLSKITTTFKYDSVAFPKKRKKFDHQHQPEITNNPFKKFFGGQDARS